MALTAVSPLQWAERPRAGRYRRLLPYAARQRRTVLATTALTVAVAALTALEPWPLKILVDYALGSAAPAGWSPPVMLAAAALSSFVLWAARAAADSAIAYAWTAAGQRMVADLASDLFHRQLRLSVLHHARRPVGDALSRVTDDAWCATLAVQGLLVSPVQCLLTLSAVGVVAWRLDPPLAAIALAMAPALAASAFFFGGPLKRRARLDREARSRLLSFVHQALTAIPVIQAFGAEGRNRSQFRNLAEEAVVLSQRTSLLNSAYGAVNGLTFVAGTACVFYFGGRRALAGALSVGTLVVFLAYLRSMQAAWQSLLQNYATMKTVQASIDRALEVFDADPEVAELPGARSVALAGAVGFDRVTFGYERGAPVLRGVSLDVRPGETVAVVGASGAGKSTLASLVPRWFDPWEGRVFVGGHDVRSLALASLRSQVAMVLQEPFLLAASVADNIAYGRPAATRVQIEAAAEAAQALDFIRRLPQGFDTVIGEEGATLSGGEKQRLAIARALLKDAPFLILDEPTSALDAVTEAALLGALERLMQGRTTLLIAHRLSTVRRADRIVVMDNGAIAEQGAPGDLLRRDGPYRRLYALQFHGPVPEAPS